MKIGSLFSGAGGLDLAVEHVFGGRTVWHCELEKLTDKEGKQKPNAAVKVLAQHWPGVPNLDDICAVDWSSVEPVDVLCGGFPCQDISAAGKRAGMGAGTRSGLWSEFARAIDELRPPLVVIENVRNLLSVEANRNVESAAATVGDGPGRPILRALGAVLGDLSDLGYDAQWTTVSASSVGAPHQRERVFVLAYPACQPGILDNGDQLCAGRRTQRHGSNAGSGAATDTAGKRGANIERRRATEGQSVIAEPGAGDGDSDRPTAEGVRQLRGVATELAPVELLPTPASCNPNDGESPETWLKRRNEVRERLKNGNGMGMPLSIAVQLLSTPQDRDYKGVPSDGFNSANLCRDVAQIGSMWGKYAPAIQRWESITRPAPTPTELNTKGKKRLSAPFPEWMMGLPAGWVTQVPGISRNDQLRIIGNGVCPQQAVAALSWLLKVSECAA